MAGSSTEQKILEDVWRRVEVKRAPKVLGVADGRIICAEILLGGAWHPVAFATDPEGFEKLAGLPKQARALLLESLACAPVRSNLLRVQPRGRNTTQSLACWRTARWLGPLLLEWAQEAKARKNPLYRRVLRMMKAQTGIADREPETVAAYLVEKNWANACALNPQRFRTGWPGPSPASQPRQFWKKIMKGINPHRTLIRPAPLDELVTGILDGKDTRKIYVLSDGRMNGRALLPDFRC
jgi:hypothetical protein